MIPEACNNVIQQTEWSLRHVTMLCNRHKDSWAWNLWEPGTYLVGYSLYLFSRYWLVVRVYRSDSGYLSCINSINSVRWWWEIFIMIHDTSCQPPPPTWLIYSPCSQLLLSTPKPKPVSHTYVRVCVAINYAMCDPKLRQINLCK